jgi:TRAP-type C4-dicarboxylate transport system substrate-binding protein
MRKSAFWLFGLVLAVTLGVGVDVTAQPAPAQPRTLSIATLAPPGSTWMRAFDAWNRELRRRSNGTLQFRFYPGGVQGDESEVIRKIRNGRLDGAAVTAVGLAQVYRPALVFQLPGILRTYAQLDAARNALATEMDAGFESGGFKLLGWADVGQSRLFSTVPIAAPSQIRGRKPWVWRDDLVLPEFFRAIRANAVPLQLPEVLGALQTNRIDCLFSTPVAAVALQWSSRISHVTDLPLAIVLGGTVLGKRQWDSLTEEQRTLLKETGVQFHALARRNLRRDETTAMQALVQRNIQLVPVNAQQRQEWLTVAATVRQRLAGQVADQALIDRVAAFGR